MFYGLWAPPLVWFITPVVCLPLQNMEGALLIIGIVFFFLFHLSLAKPPQISQMNEMLPDETLSMSGQPDTHFHC